MEEQIENIEIPTPEVTQEPKQSSDASSEDLDRLTTIQERVIATFAYIGPLGVVPFYLKKESEFCRFHGKQGLLIYILFFFFQIFAVLDLVDDVFKVLKFSIFLYMGYQALSGKWKKFPWIYNTACELEKQLSMKPTQSESKDDYASNESEPKD